MSGIDPLVETIRKEAKSGIWSNGVNLARAGKVVLESRTDAELVLRIRAPGRPVPWTAVLYPNDDAWECDCPSKVDPCEHVVAAVLTVQQAQTQAVPVAVAAERFARVLYRFTRAESGLALRRAIVDPDGNERALDQSLTALLADPAEAAKLQLEKCDLQADRLLDRPTRVALHPDKLNALLQILEPARNVLLDGRPVAISGDVVFPQVVVEDQGPQIAVRLQRDARVTEVVSPGVALCTDALCRLG
ncbi:MAG: SWIM zinc finger family protein, partial [Myxococcaceae bacterium]